MAQINIRSDQHGILIGGTGDGKTTAAMKIAAMIIKSSKQHLVVLNPGAEPVYFDEIGPATETINQDWPKVQHVTPYVYKDLREYGTYFNQILQKGNVLTLIDELAMMGTGSQYATSLKYLYQMGRRRNCGTWAISQRPRTIPPFAVNQSSHILIGDVMGTDLDYLEKMTGQPLRQVWQERKQYEFIYWSRLTKLPPQVIRI